MTIPPFFLEPRSLLERWADVCVCFVVARAACRHSRRGITPSPPPPSPSRLMHPDLLVAVPALADPLARMKGVLRWFMSGWHYRTVGVKKPFNVRRALRARAHCCDFICTRRCRGRAVQAPADTRNRDHLPLPHPTHCSPSLGRRLRASGRTRTARARSTLRSRSRTARRLAQYISRTRRTAFRAMRTSGPRGSFRRRRRRRLSSTEPSVRRPVPRRAPRVCCMHGVPLSPTNHPVRGRRAPPHPDFLRQSSASRPCRRSTT